MHEGINTTITIKDACNASIDHFWALILFKIIRAFEPINTIELGTCIGISSAYQAAAQTINEKGHITTMEGAASLATLSQKNLKELGINNVLVVSGRFQDNLDSVLNENKPIDYAFIDGHHDEKATLSYFESILPFLSDQSIMVFDDISWSGGMRRAWNKIVENENVKIAVDLRSIGICAIEKELNFKHEIRIPLF